MITTPEEYLANLILINDQNIPSQAILLPSTENVYEINLNTRTIETPEYLSTQKDHYAETIYFKCDRYFDNMDLSTATCVINYIHKNVKDEMGQQVPGHIYAVPFLDISTEPGKILIPWCISGDATKYAGTINFSINFYQLQQNADTLEYKIIYSLNTLPAISKILHGLEIENIAEEEAELATSYQILVQRINDIENQYKAGLYWLEA